MKQPPSLRPILSHSSVMVGLGLASMLNGALPLRAQPPTPPVEEVAPPPPPAQAGVLAGPVEPADGADETPPVDWEVLEVLPEEQRASLERAVETARWSAAYAASSKLLEQMRARVIPRSGKPAGEVELSAPAEAVAFYGEWLLKAPFKTQDEKYLGVRLCSIAGQLYARDLGLPQRALEIYDRGIVRFWNDAWVIHLRLERDRLIRERQGVLKLAEKINVPAPVVPVPMGATSVGSKGIDSLKLDSLKVNGLKVGAGAALNPVRGEGVTSLNLPGMEAPTPGKSVVPDSAAVSITKAAAGEKAGPSGVTSSGVTSSGVTSIDVPEGIGSTPKTATPPVQSTLPLAVPASNLEISRPPVVVGKGAVQVVKQGALQHATLWQQLKSGNLSAETAWKNGDLNFENIVHFLERETGDWLIHERKIDNGLRPALIQLVLQHESQRLQNLSALSPRLRLWIGDYLQNQRDERAVPVLESILAELKPQQKGQEDFVFQAVERLGWFYRDKGEHEKSAQTWLRLEALVDKTGWWLPSAYLAAARSMKRARQPGEAARLYALVPQNGDNWSTTVATCDQVRELLTKKQHGAARQILIEAIAKAQDRECRSTLLSFLSYSYRLTHEWNEAQRVASEALKGFKILNMSKQADNSQGARMLAQSTLQEAENWLRDPIQMGSREIHIAVPKGSSTPVVCRLNLRTSSNGLFSVKTDSPWLKARVITGDGWANNSVKGEYGEIREIVIEVESANVQDSQSSALTIQDSKLNVQARVSVQIEVR